MGVDVIRVFELNSIDFVGAGESGKTTVSGGRKSKRTIGVTTLIFHIGIRRYSSRLKSYMVKDLTSSVRSIGKSSE
jgi:hypothetical protein